MARGYNVCQECGESYDCGEIHRCDGERVSRQPEKKEDKHLELCQRRGIYVQPRNSRAR